jgi:hypothetical protein
MVDDLLKIYQHPSSYLPLSPTPYTRSKVEAPQMHFYVTINYDDLAKSHRNDGFVKSSRCKARKN